MKINNDGQLIDANGDLIIGHQISIVTGEIIFYSDKYEPF